MAFLIVGMGRSGCGAAQLLLSRGAHVTGCDARMESLLQTPAMESLIARGLIAVPESSIDIKNLALYDTIISSPGISPAHPILSAAREQNIRCMGEMELALRSIHPNQRLLGITGTNGKTTVTLMVTHVLNACGITARAVGNVGVALCGEIDTAAPTDVLVVELSSYQLEPIQLPVLDAAVILNITPDHIDRHGSMLGYAQAKFQIGRCLKPAGRLFVQADVAADFPGLTADLPVESYPADASHDVENARAAQLLCATLGVTASQFQQAVASFCKPAHRIEFVLRHGDVDFYNDSKGTNLDAVDRAVRAMRGPVVLIAGGVDKGFSYRAWLPTFRDKVRAIHAIGQAAPKLQQELSEVAPVRLAASLQEAVANAAADAQPGDSVLLSPGCASFDMFRDYAHRGDEFKKIVKELVEGRRAE